MSPPVPLVGSSNDDQFLTEDINKEDDILDELDNAAEEELLHFSEDDDFLEDTREEVVEYVDEDGNPVELHEGEQIEVLAESEELKEGETILNEEVEESFAESGHDDTANIPEEDEEEEDEDDDEDEARRTRFRTERRNIVTINSNKRNNRDIPDSLDSVVLEEEAAKAAEFMNREKEKKRGNWRGNRRGGLGGSNQRMMSRKQPPPLLSVMPQPQNKSKDQQHQVGIAPGATRLPPPKNFQQVSEGFPGSSQSQGLPQTPPRPQVPPQTIEGTPTPPRKILINPHFRGPRAQTSTTSPHSLPITHSAGTTYETETTPKVPYFNETHHTHYDPNQQQQPLQHYNPQYEQDPNYGSNYDQLPPPDHNYPPPPPPPVAPQHQIPPHQGTYHPNPDHQQQQQHHPHHQPPPNFQEFGHHPPPPHLQQRPPHPNYRHPPQDGWSGAIHPHRPPPRMPHHPGGPPPQHIPPMPHHYGDPRYRGPHPGHLPPPPMEQRHQIPPHHHHPQHHPPLMPRFQDPHHFHAPPPHLQQQYQPPPPHHQTHFRPPPPQIPPLQEYHPPPNHYNPSNEYQHQFEHSYETDHRSEFAENQTDLYKSFDNNEWNDPNYNGGPPNATTSSNRGFHHQTTRGLKHNFVQRRPINKRPVNSNDSVNFANSTSPKQMRLENRALSNIKEVPITENITPVPLPPGKEILPAEDEDEETKELRRQLEQQKKIREENLRKKEERRRQMAAQRLKELNAAANQQSQNATVTNPNSQPKPNLQPNVEGYAATKVQGSTLVNPNAKKKVVVVRRAQQNLGQQQGNQMQGNKTRPNQVGASSKMVLVRGAPRGNSMAARGRGNVNPNNPNQFGGQRVNQFGQRINTNVAGVPVYANPKGQRQQLIRGQGGVLRRGMGNVRAPTGRIIQPNQIRHVNPNTTRVFQAAGAPVLKSVPKMAAVKVPANRQVIAADNRENLSSLRRVQLPEGETSSTNVSLNTRVVRPPQSQEKCVLINNLSASTTENQLRQLTQPVGAVEMIKLMKDGRAIITFKQPNHAIQFQQKYQRYMLDLSMIQVSMISPQMS